MAEAMSQESPISFLEIFSTSSRAEPFVDVTRARGRAIVRAWRGHAEYTPATVVGAMSLDVTVVMKRGVEE